MVHSQKWWSFTKAVVALLPIMFASGCSFLSTDADDARAKDYVKLLSVKRVESYYHVEPKTKASYPLVRGEISNLGSESLEVVEFNVKFKDLSNRVIYEEKAYPVFLSEYSSASPQSPLVPGQTMKFALKFPSCPPEWKPGQLDIEISKLVFKKH
ncbi:MAG TPA: hypothetical protein VMW38_14805 [Terriglobia bacterium]|nr:hypothetical protein [Terriglobia bacterium]